MTRSRRLLDTARGMPCTLQIPGVCLGAAGRATVVSCHSNRQADGKGMGFKASDAETVFGCAACHRALDQGLQRDRLQWYWERARRLTDQLRARMA